MATSHAVVPFPFLLNKENVKYVINVFTFVTLVGDIILVIPRSKLSDKCLPSPKMDQEEAIHRGFLLLPPVGKILKVRLKMLLQQ